MSTVLLVEDDLGNRTIIEDIFAFDGIGAELSVVETGEEALRVVSELNPLLILMDIRLPGMDGLEVIRALRMRPATKGISIWATTAYARTEDRKKAIEAGCDDYVTKPFDRASLVKKLRDFVRSHGTSDVA